jgi:uncharacterized protein (TIGR03067 family)
MTQFGTPAPAAALKGFRLSISGNTLTLSGGGLNQRASFTLDPTKTPKHMDSVDLDGANKGKKQLGIYELTDRQLKICMGIEGGTTRPKSFTSTAADKQSLIVLQRASGTAAAGKVVWKDFTPKSKAFTVKMPGDVSEVTQTSPSPYGNVTVTLCVSVQPKASYIVTTVELPATALKGGADQFFTEAKGRLAAVPGVKVTSEQTIKLGTHPGREWMLSMPGQGMKKTRSYLVGNRSISIEASPVTKENEKDFQTFFDSLKVEK